MTLKVIGAGLGRTGTLSLKQALEQLGLGRCYHATEVFKIPGAPELWERAAKGEELWEEIFQGFSATVDWPAATFYERLAHKYPEAKVILSLRDPDAWFDSAQNTIFKAMDRSMDDMSQASSRMLKLTVTDMFDGRIHDRAHATAVFRAHNERAKQVIPPERLLVYQAGEGWEPLCRFLGVPVPGAPYPKVNTSEDFAKMLAGAER
jgi:hypothetical protein